MDVFIASQTNRRKFVYVRHPLKLLRIRTKLGPKLYIDPPRRCSSRDHGRRGHGRRETFVSTNYKLLNWSDWSGPPVIRSTCRRSVSCRMRKGEKLEKNLATSRPEPVSPSSRPICLSVEHLLFFPLLLPPPPPFSSTLNLISLGWAANFSISGSVGTLFGSMLLPPRFDWNQLYERRCAANSSTSSRLLHPLPNQWNIHLFALPHRARSGRVK